MTITGKREGWRLSTFSLVFLAFDALYQRLSSSRSAVSPFKPEAGSLQEGVINLGLGANVDIGVEKIQGVRPS